MEKTQKPDKVIGILALQGDYEAHRRMLEEQIGARTAFVRRPEELADVDALILPGGESTTIAKLMERIGLDKAIQVRAQAGMPIYGTCAGLILLAKDIEGRPDQPTLGLMDVRVARNAFGRQVDSFEADLPFAPDSEANAPPVRGVFIRAPYVTEVAPDVQVLCRFQNKIVGVRQGNLLGTAFHPELTDNPRIHAYFAHMVDESTEKR
ncbi:MAG TPA: pyridoxal 5'-phosphate synthase glutaminase subunit PdxT [Chthonomonadaceae bacterium]|nr:pyridoxal 5'-phosphate synthase glutaminase subunit PdxT [Chthonomonadaceae bacterium]